MVRLHSPNISRLYSAWNEKKLRIFLLISTCTIFNSSLVKICSLQNVQLWAVKILFYIFLTEQEESMTNTKS